MNDSWHLALVAFAAMITPGPNNVLVTEAAATRTLLATVAVMAAVVGGSMVILAITQMGVSSVLAASPALHLGLKLVSAALLVGLGLAMMLRSSVTSDFDHENPVGPLAVLGLQFVNPKGWALMLAIGALDVPTGRAILIVGSISLACLCLWAMAGAALGRLLIDARRKRYFGVTMGVLLAVSAPLVLI